MYFSRLTLNRFAPTRALSSLLDPADPDQAADAHHKLIWSLFGDGAERARDFLWRADGKGRFFVLSARAPMANDLFSPPEVKAFDPQLTPGDRLVFALRANATKDKSRGGKGRRVCVVMDRLHDLPHHERAAARAGLAQEAATEWLTVQGARRGFVPLHLDPVDYSTRRIGRRAQFGVLEISGQIEVTDPAQFRPALATGFGRSKAWGCGLMLIRRA